MDYALYLGCAIPIKALKYELSARNIAARFGINLIDLKCFTCCGFPVKSMDNLAALYLSARNLVIAESQGLDIVGLCSGCVATLSEAIIMLEDINLRKEINGLLKKEGIGQYKGILKVRHLAKILSKDTILEQISNNISFDLTNKCLAIHYGCHYLKPSEAHGKLEDVNRPTSISKIVKAIGAKEIDYDLKSQCCGLTMMSADESIAYQLAGSKLKDIAEKGADALIVACPSCCVAFENNQKIACKAVDTTLSMPVLYYTQLMGLAIGMSDKELGFEFNRVAFKW
ncbi:MAG: CoB--CoM heterodisulfide reductase iron-sulfur subunit B family protein [Thermodesulfovibrionales bacterium]|nr:CoB--CoM heterodisulfide reductase iron-sulfur subunit B family protein [Thermodesulfovibrionales bacterium]